MKHSLDQPVGRIFQLRLYPTRPFWVLGSGWAAVGGGLAVAGVARLPETWLKLLLAWLLTELLLGAVWDLGAGSISPSPVRGMWRRLLSPRLPEAARPLRLLPYIQVGSPGHRVAQRLGRMRRWWQDTLLPDARREFYTLVASLGLALLLGVLLGRQVLLLVLVSMVLSFLAVVQRGERDQDSEQMATRHQAVLALWYALGEFGVPWLIGAAAIGALPGAVILLGVCYAITYYGLIQDGGDFRLIWASQASAALLLAGLRHPITAGTVAILSLPQWGLRVWESYLLTQKPGLKNTGNRRHTSIFAFYSPFIILSMLIAALALTT